MAKTLLTGASGFVGAALARLLLAEGHELRLLVRGSSPRGNLEGLDAEVVTGDLTDGSSLRRAASGCRYVFHAAADYRLWVPDPERMYRANVEGTVALLRAAAAAGAERVVYTSSVATLSLRGGGCADESCVAEVADMIGHYKRSKFLAEARAMELAGAEGVPVVVVNPSTPVGPRDIKPTPTGRIVVDFLNGRMPAYVDTGLNVVHVDDVARGHLLALSRGKVGERYILGGENLTLREILGHLAELTGRRAPRVRLPHAAVWPVALACEAACRLTGGEPRVSREALRMSRKHMFFTSERAMRELGHAARPAREALRDAVDWFRASGYCA